MGAFPGCPPVFEQIMEASGAVMNHNALKIELIFQVEVLHTCCKY